MYYFAAKNGKLFIVNGRLTERKLKSYLKFKWFIRNTVNRAEKIMVQSDFDKKRYEKLGISENKIKVYKNLKYSIKYNEISDEKKKYYFDTVLDKNKKIIVLPGPPKEMTWMMDNQAMPLLEKYSDSILLMKTLEIKGIPEGKIDEELEKYFKMSNPTVAPYAKEKCVHVRIAMKGLRENSENIEKEIDKIVEEIREIYPNAVMI